MVRIKFTTRPRTPVVSPKFASMALDNAPDVSMEQSETSSEQLEDSLVDQWKIALMKAASEQGAESNRESQFGGIGDSAIASDEGERVKVGAAAALAGISYDFGLSTIMRTHIGSLESYKCFFLKGYDQPPGSESVLNPQPDEVVVFEDFFAAGLLMPPHLVLVDILRKFLVQLH
jgi:hypothetical protein